MKSHPAENHNDTTRGSTRAGQTSTNPLEVIERIGAQFFDMAAMVAVLSGVGLTALAVFTQVSTSLQTGIVTDSTLQSYFPLDVSADLGPTPSSAFNGLILLLWQSWIGLPLLAVSGFCFLLFRKIASEFRRLYGVRANWSARSIHAEHPIDRLKVLRIR